jgi:hypothetical protein
MNTQLSLLGFLLCVCTQIVNAQQVQNCGTQATAEEIAYMESFGPVPEYMDDDTVYISVVYFVGRRSDGSGGLDPGVLEVITQQLNEYYINAGVQFYQCGGVNFIDSDEYYNFERPMERAVCNPRDRPGAMNVYFFNSVSDGMGQQYCGYTYFPNSRRDRILMRNDCALNESIFAHEVGHFFSLYHTHGKTNFGTTDELVDGSNCLTAGDNICDTPADPNLYKKVDSTCVYTGAETDLQGDPFEPDPANIMSYAPRHCKDYLSPGQYERISFSARNHRPYMQPCCPDNFGIETDYEPVTCPGDSDGVVRIVSVNGFNPDTFHWSVGGDSTVLEGVPAGRYVAVATDLNGCVASDTIYLVDPPIPGIEKNVVPLHCDQTNGVIELGKTSGQGPVRYASWFGLDTLDRFDSLDAGWYYFAYEDSVGCTAIDSIEVGVAALPQLPLGDTLFRYCANEEVRFPGFALSDSTWVSQWVDTSGMLLAIDSLIDLPIHASQFVIRTVDTVYSCVVLDTIRIADSLIDLQPALDVVTSNLSLQLADVTRQPVGERYWSIDGVRVDSQHVCRVLVDGPGWYEVCLELSNRCGEAVTCDSVWLDIFHVKTDAIDVRCAGDRNGRIDLDIEGDSIAYFHSWTSEDGRQGEGLVDLTPGTYIIEVEDEHGTVVRDTVVVGEPEPLALDSVAIRGSAANEGRIELVVSGGIPPYRLNWSHGAEGSVADNLPPGEYWCEVIDANLCRKTLGPFDVPTVSSVGSLSKLNAGVFPSPFDEHLTLTFGHSAKAGTYRVTLFDLAGKMHYDETVYHGGGSGSYQLDVSGLPSGGIMFRLQSGFGSMQRVLVKR